jgi:hypothetical protein
MLNNYVMLNLIQHLFTTLKKTLKRVQGDVCSLPQRRP